MSSAPSQQKVHPDPHSSWPPSDQKEPGTQVTCLGMQANAPAGTTKPVLELIGRLSQKPMLTKVDSSQDLRIGLEIAPKAIEFRDCDRSEAKATHPFELVMRAPEFALNGS